MPKHGSAAQKLKSHSCKDHTSASHCVPSKAAYVYLRRKRETLRKESFGSDSL